jgi:hypothetical protein
MKFLRLRAKPILIKERNKIIKPTYNASTVADSRGDEIIMIPNNKSISPPARDQPQLRRWVLLNA